MHAGLRLWWLPIIFLFLSFFGFINFLALPAFAQVSGDWPMVAGNPERTSWTPTEVKGVLAPLWYLPFKPYINYKTQIVAADNKIFVSTAKGVYAINADTGSFIWMYPTELPPGNSPTYSQGTLYVGGYDRKLHAIDVVSGQVKSGWQWYSADAGFEANPLVVNQTVYIGNRDGNLYAFDAVNGGLKWKFPTGGPIHQSAAYKNNILYFASDDGYAYAVNAATKAQVWKSAKLLAGGFRSYWPVIYRNWVIFSGDDGYRDVYPFLWTHPTQERIEIFGADAYGKTIVPQRTPVGPLGAVPGDWALGTTTMDTSRSSVGSAGEILSTSVSAYFENKPWRHTVFYLNLLTGQEYSYDSDTDGKPEYAPFLYFGTHSGNRYPPIVGGDGVIYQSNMTHSDSYIPRGKITGWKPGTPYISVIGSDFAVDEPLAYSAGGKLIYWSLCCDRRGGAFDVSIAPAVSWTYYSYNLPTKAPQYTDAYYGNDYNGWGLFGNVNGAYGKHGVLNPPIPYQGKVYELKGNSLIAWSSSGSSKSPLPAAPVSPPVNPADGVAASVISDRLQKEIQKMVVDAAGNVGPHLQPGLLEDGIGGFQLNRRIPGDFLTDYFKNPGDLHLSLIRALPHLPAALQQQVKTYLKKEWDLFPPYTYVHIGFNSGVQREIYTRKPEIISEQASFGPRTSRRDTTFTGWNFPPHQFYAMWQYAKTMGEAKIIFDAAKTRLETAPGDAYLIERPYVHNAYIAGYRGYVELEKLAGYIGTINQSVKYAEYRRLVDLRLNTFSKDSPYVIADPAPPTSTINYDRILNLARNFMFLTPELADEMGNNPTLKARVAEAIAEYQVNLPGWFVARYDGTGGEGALQHLYDRHALFQAQALILKTDQHTLSKYLDVPAFALGDLFYIDNLVAALEAPTNVPSPTSIPPALRGDFDLDGDEDVLDLARLIGSFNNENCSYNLTGTGCLITLHDFNSFLQLLTQ